jgi:hypothetical protein
MTWANDAENFSAGTFPGPFLGQLLGPLCGAMAS